MILWSTLPCRWKNTRSVKLGKDGFPCALYSVSFGLAYYGVDVRVHRESRITPVPTETVPVSRNVQVTLLASALLRR